MEPKPGEKNDQSSHNEGMRSILLFLAGLLTLSYLSLWLDAQSLEQTAKDEKAGLQVQRDSQMQLASPQAPLPLLAPKNENEARPYSRNMRDRSERSSRER